MFLVNEIYYRLGLNLNPQQEGFTIYVPIPKVSKIISYNKTRNCVTINKDLSHFGLFFIHILSVNCYLNCKR